MTITTCPSCGSQEIQCVQRDWIEEYKGKNYTVPALVFYECPVCGEKVYDRDAMRKIERYSPAFNKAVQRKTSPRKRNRRMPVSSRKEREKV